MSKQRNKFICENCNKEFSILCSQSVNGRRFCSLECRRSFPIEKRFWRYVDRKSDDECWNWIGYKTHLGYGKILIEKRPKSCSRLSWELTYGTIPVGMCVCHKCDNPPCCNPKHLFLGTMQDNMNDKALKGRSSRLAGDKSWDAKFTWEQIRKIREQYVPRKVTTIELSKKYNVSVSTIWRIVQNRSWKE